MSNLNQIIDYTKAFQDVELATAVGQLKQNPSQLQQFLQQQQGKVYSDIIKQKDSTFQKVYGDLTRASKSQEAAITLDKRSKELAEIHQQIYNKEKGSATAILDDKNLAERKYEMNQWSIGNKNDTLFVFSMLFIILSTLILITTLWRMGLISGALCGSLWALLIVIYVITIIIRSQYTNVYRDKRYWNRNNFNNKYGKITVPQCPQQFISGLESEFQTIKSDIQSDVSSATQAVESEEQSISQDISSTAQNINKDITSTTKSISQYI
jgi:hypothetical protein